MHNLAGIHVLHRMTLSTAKRRLAIWCGRRCAHV